MKRAPARPEFDRRMKLAYAAADRARPQSEKWLFDDNGKVVKRLVIEDVEPVIDGVKELRNHMDNGWTKDRSMRLIGRIPNIIIDKWFNEGFNIFRCKDPKEIRRRLNEYNKFRTTSGMV